MASKLQYYLRLWQRMTCRLKLQTGNSMAAQLNQRLTGYRNMIPFRRDRELTAVPEHSEAFLFRKIRGSQYLRRCQHQLQDNFYQLPKPSRRLFPGGGVLL